MDKQYNPDGFIPKHDGYEKLITYQKSEIIYDGTYHFTKKYFQLEKEFLNEGGLREKMSQARIEIRKKQK